MADRRCAMCGFPISSENECNVFCVGPCRRIFHISCVVGSTVGSSAPNSKNHWRCCTCKSLATSELASSALKSAFLPVKNSVESPENARKQTKPRSTDSPNTENLSNAVEFLGGQIDIFNRIVVKFKKRMEDFEKLNRELKNENEELKIEVQALRKRVEAVENDQIFGQCHLNSSADEMNYSSGSGSFDFPEIAPGIFVLPESVVENLEMMGLANPEAVDTDKEKLRVKFEIPESTSPLGFRDDPGSEPTPEMTPVPEYIVRATSMDDLLCQQKPLEAAESDGKLKVRFELPPPSPLGFDSDDPGPDATSIVDESPPPPTIVVVPSVVERKLRSALKPARKHFGNVVVRLMAEEYLSGKNE